jgi:dihydrofolate reductase
LTENRGKQTACIPLRGQTMRPIIVFNRISLDGFFAGPNGEIDWFIRDPDLDAALHRGVGGSEPASSGQPAGLIAGRVTYQLFESVWPKMASDPSAPEPMKQTGREMNEMTKYVFSTTLQELTWENSVLLRGNLAEEVRSLRENDGSPILIFGSGTIVQQLAAAGLIDEYWLAVTPVVLGAGKPLFAGTPRQSLKLLGSQVFSSGNVLLHYRAA